jgi:hypothetical protein
MASINPVNATGDYYSYAEELRRTGVVVLPPFLMFNAEELDQINVLQSSIQEEKVIRNHDVYVRRVLIDRKGSLPQKPIAVVSDQILGLLTDSKRSTAFASLFQSDSTRQILRCQINRMVKGSFIARHLDLEANPGYEYSAILQLSPEYKGGEFVIFPEVGDERTLPPLQRGSVLVISCTLRHCVKAVSENERKSLAWFYSKANYHGCDCNEWVPS